MGYLATKMNAPVATILSVPLLPMCLVLGIVWDYMQNYDTTYSVHKNDCRHFVDQCAAAAMGMSGRASKRAPSQRMQEAGVPGWHQNVFAVAANLVDYNNWAWVKTGCQLTLASVVLTRSPLTPLKYALAPLKVAAIH